MTAASRLDRLNRAVVSPTRGAGELVRLPRGEVLAVVELPGDAAEALGARGTKTGSRLPLQHQVHPALLLTAAAAAGLLEQDPVTVRGVGYLVVNLTPDGQGMTRVALMLPGAEEGPRPEWQQWR
jgi:hypothetical protein